ncbi:GTP-binding protein [Achromobacter sp. ACM03]|uniref:CobW family GTP-binding protein n=1 Tax=Achromobacter sp. ACM03 TaxID=2769300 RepID=UPI00177AFC9B|nr:GTP-binding protein [Achromobacter sp. ACM03]MBD9430187.1 GTP-binding protein [Achromobacter sp. ACM03]
MAIDETSETRIPVTLLTGFLGSGKTTLLNHWLRDPALADAAVIVNEFGEIGIDHALIASSNDNTIELSTGCLCCTVQGDLVETLRDLRAKRSAGQIPAFDRVLIETTGMADVVPVIQALMTFPVARSFRLNRVLTVVDAVNGPGTLAAHPEAIKQVAVADALIVTKTDLPDARATALVDTLAQVNPGATRLVCDPAARPDATVLDGPDVYDVDVRPEQARQWLNAAPYADGHGHGHHHEHTHAHDHARIDSFCLDFADPLHWSQVSAWLDALVMAHPDELLRVKGILHIAGHERPIVLQAVQRLFHPPVELPQWPDADRQSRMVFITKGLSKDYVMQVWDTVRERALPPAARAA